MSRAARYPLVDVTVCMDEMRYWFSAPSRSINEVIRIYEKLGRPKNESEARDFVLQEIRRLQPGNFVQSVVQWGDSQCVADVYGALIEGQPWYIKFRIDEEGWLEQISFHPPAHALMTQSGSVIPAGGSIDEKQKVR